MKARFYGTQSAEYRKRCSIMEVHQSRAAGFFLLRVGTWLSLVEHSLGVRGVGSSNLPVPTNFSSQHSAVSSQAKQFWLSPQGTFSALLRIFHCTGNPATSTSPRSAHAVQTC